MIDQEFLSLQDSIMSNSDATSICTILTGNNTSYMSEAQQAEARSRADAWLAARQTD